MSALRDLLLSPAGLALYAGFWVLKLTVGAWVLTRAAAFLPARAQVWMEAKRARLPWRRDKGPLA